MTIRVQLIDLAEKVQELRRELCEAQADICMLKDQLAVASANRRKQAMITAPSIDGWEDYTVTLSAGEWEKVKRGEYVKVTGPSVRFGEDRVLQDYWEFFGGVGGRFSYSIDWGDGGEIEEEYVNNLVAHNIREIDAED